MLLGCHNKVPQSGQLRMIGIYSIMVLETRSVILKCPDDYILNGTLRQDPSPWESNLSQLGLALGEGPRASHRSSSQRLAERIPTFPLLQDSLTVLTCATFLP